MLPIIQRTHHALRVVVLAAITIGSGSVLAQAPLQRLEGLASSDYFGASIRIAGDIDGDGVLDLVVGASQNVTGMHGPNPGYVRVFSGVDFSVIYEWHGHGTAWTDGPDDHFGHSVDGAGDVDGDGRDDILVGAYKDDDGGQNAGEFFVFSGATGAVIHNFDGDQGGDRMGYSVSGLGDVNADGRADLLIGVYKRDIAGFNSGAARVVSGFDGALLYEVHGDGVGDGLGWNVDGLGDVDGDSVPDFIAGAFEYVQVGSTGYARVYSGVNGAELYTLSGDLEWDHFGWSVCGLGDLDGDGVADVAVGATQVDLFGVAVGPGYVRVYSGVNGQQLFQFDGENDGDGFGWAIDGAGDVNGDGVEDIIVGAPRWGDVGGLGLPGYARVYSGADGVEIQRMSGATVGDLYGFSVTGGLDRGADGYADVWVGAMQDFDSGPEAGYAELYGGMCNPAPLNYCIGAANSAGAGARMGIHGSLSIAANNLTLTSSGCPPQHFGIFFYGPDAVQLPFGNGYRCVAGTILRLSPAVSTGASGDAALAVDYGSAPMSGAPGAVLPGATWNFQFWYRDVPAGGAFFNLSDGLRLTFCQ